MEVLSGRTYTLLEKFGQFTGLVSLAVRRRMGTGQQLPERDDDPTAIYKYELPEGIWTNEEVDNYALYCRELVGALGFVSYDPEMGIRRTPRNTDIDLELYLIEMMKYNRKQFLERWEGSPLVIKRYEILYSIIRDELGVEL